MKRNSKSDTSVVEPRAAEKPSSTTKPSHIDEKVDKEVVYEFGGPIGVSIMMVVFPCIMYYLWICCEFYHGSLVHPESFADIIPFYGRMW